MYGFTFSCFGVSSLLGGVLIKFGNQLIGYDGFVWFAFAVTCLSFFLVYMMDPDMHYDYVEHLGGRAAVEKMMKEDEIKEQKL